jgi:hypothetical protein
VDYTVGGRQDQKQGDNKLTQPLIKTPGHVRKIFLQERDARPILQNQWASPQLCTHQRIDHSSPSVSCHDTYCVLQKSWLVAHKCTEKSYILIYIHREHKYLGSGHSLLQINDVLHPGEHADASMIQASWTWWGWGGWPVLRPGPSSGPSKTSSADSWWWWEGLWPSTAQLQPSCHHSWGFPATGSECANIITFI